MGNPADQVRNFLKQNKSEKVIKNITEYIESDWGLNYRLYPVQKFILKCFYGLPLEKTKKTITIWDESKTQKLHEFSELEYLYYLIKNERTNLKSHDDVLKHKNTLILVCGRRSGKTTITAGIASYETYRLLNLNDPQSYYKMKRNAKISITCVATGKEQAKEVFDEIKSHYNDVPFFKEFLYNNASTHSSFKTGFDLQNDLVPSIHIKAKSCQGKGLRGAANIVAIMDEIAHFIQEAKSDASDEAVYQSITPSTATFNNPENPDLGEGKIIMLSSPLGRSGVFWNEYLNAMEKPVDYSQTLVIQAPTWEINPNINATMLRNEKAKNPEKFYCEYGARFTDSISSWIGDKNFLTQCIDENLKPKEKGLPGMPHYIGIDLGFTEDGTAIAIGHINSKGEIELDYHRIISPLNPADSDFLNLDFEGSVPILDTEKIVDFIVDLSKRFYIVSGIFDQVEGFSFEQSLAKRGIKTIRRYPMSEKRKSDMYQKFRKLLMDKKVRLYHDDEMVNQLTHLQRKVIGEYLIRVSKPSGFKDDLADSLSRLVFLAYDNLDKGALVAKKVTGSAGAPKLYGKTLYTYHKNRSKEHNFDSKRSNINSQLKNKFKRF